MDDWMTTLLVIMLTSHSQYPSRKVLCCMINKNMTAITWGGGVSNPAKIQIYMQSSKRCFLVEGRLESTKGPIYNDKNTGLIC